MYNTLLFPNTNKLMYKEALQSLVHFYRIGEAKSCSVLHGARSVTVRTPKGMWILTKNEWNKEEFNPFR